MWTIHITATVGFFCADLPEFELEVELEVELEGVERLRGGEREEERREGEREGEWEGGSNKGERFTITQSSAQPESSWLEKEVEEEADEEEAGKLSK